VNIIVLLVSGTLAHLGFDRTPNGNIIPDAARRFVDDSKGDTLRQASAMVVESNPTGSTPVLTDDARKER
jgi:hypothetical protein